MASINSQRGRLYLLALLPRRDGSPGLQQTRIALRLDDTPINRRAAAKQLKTLEQQLEAGTFDWAYWLDKPSGPSHGERPSPSSTGLGWSWAARAKAHGK